jgi:hypothetical protein
MEISTGAGVGEGAGVGLGAGVGGGTAVGVGVGVAAGAHAAIRRTNTAIHDRAEPIVRFMAASFLRRSAPQRTGEGSTGCERDFQD